MAKFQEDTTHYIPIEELENQYHPEDIAAYILTVPIDEQVHILEQLPIELAAEVFVELDEYLKAKIFVFFSNTRATLLLHSLSPDDAADILRELEPSTRRALLQSLPIEDARELRKLISFSEDTAAGLMNTEIVILNKNLTAGEAMHHILTAMQEEKEIPYYAYIVDDDDILCGVLSLRDVLLMKAYARLSTKLSDKPLITLSSDTPDKEVVKLMDHYNFKALPVIDGEGKVLGVITYQDIEHLQDEGHDMMLGMVGVSTDETVDTPWLISTKARLPWLFVNVFTSSCAAYIVSFFENDIARLAILAVLMPIVANQSGNTGQQSLAVILRQLATERFNLNRALFTIARECKIGLLAGIIIAIFASLSLFLLTDDRALSFVFGASLILDMFIGALIGASIPLILRQLGRDPAHASSIFLTMITDSAGFFIFLVLASIILL